MKIIEINIENLGPYIGVNQFSFDVDNPAKKVVLIGGKNGAGKTTLFNAIRIGMYGCRAFGYESNNTKYLEQAYELINETAKAEKASRASVTISILMDDGKEDAIYTFERSWPLNKKNRHENVVITKNGLSLSETECSDFQSYLLQLIPPDMFKFYFFDGEDIKNFVFNGENGGENSDFKNAFLKLCGLDTMELICQNFQRISNSKKKDSSTAYEDYQSAKDAKEQADKNLEEAYQEKDRLLTELVRLEEELSKCDDEFFTRGGITKDDYQKYQIMLSKEEAKREVSRKWLKEAANEYLPFVIIQDQVEALRDRIHEETKAQNASALLEYLTEENVDRQLENAFYEEGILKAEELSKITLQILLNSVKKPETELLLNLSKTEQLEVLAQIKTLLAFDKSRVFEESEVITESLNQVKEIRKVLDKSDASGAEAFFKQKESLLSSKTDIMKKQLENERAIDLLKEEKQQADVNVKKAQKKYEEYLKAQSVTDVTAKALLAFQELQRRLYKKYIADVENSFKICFERLINKSDLIDGIKIDESLQVYPYKWKTFNMLDLKTRMAENGESYLYTAYGAIANDAFAECDKNAETVTLPIEVKQHLSAGETQIFIMALYQALSKLNKVNVPYIIDTPFARIDTEHRENILNNFFMQLKGQLIVLSTDEEIVGNYRKYIHERVANYYLLRHENNNGSEILRDRYFEDVAL